MKQDGIIPASRLLLYGMLCGILSSEDNSLLMGSLLIFGVLSLVMIVTRRIDWYAGIRRHDENAARRRPQQPFNMRQTYHVLLVSYPYSPWLQSA